MEMEGITIVFICKDGSHPSIVNYRKFGNKYWDDGKDNKSKVGYWFLYYYRKQFVRVHKILKLLPKTEKPIEMKNWESETDRQILCLSPQLKEFTWHDWITDIGVGAPYAMDTYGSTNSNSWTVQELEKRSFNFQRFKSIVGSCKDEALESEDEESVLPIPSESDDDLTTKSDEFPSESEEKLFEKQLHQRIYQKTMESVHLLREEYASLSETTIAELNHSIEMLVKQRDQALYDQQEIRKGNKDEYIVTRETERRVQKSMDVIKWWV